MRSILLFIYLFINWRFVASTMLAANTFICGGMILLYIFYCTKNVCHSSLSIVMSPTSCHLSLFLNDVVTTKILLYYYFLTETLVYVLPIRTSSKFGARSRMLLVAVVLFSLYRQ